MLSISCCCCSSPPINTKGRTGISLSVVMCLAIRDFIKNDNVECTDNPVYVSSLDLVNRKCKRALHGICVYVVENRS